MWVGPIGGFLAVFLFAWWVARRVPSQKVVHAAAVGVGTAVLDLGLSIVLGGGEAIHPILFVSNVGRILAGVLAGWLATRGSGKRSPWVMNVILSSGHVRSTATEVLTG